MKNVVSAARVWGFFGRFSVSPNSAGRQSQGRRRIRTVIGLVGSALLGLATSSAAQAVTAPVGASFLQSDTEYTRTLSVKLEFFQCASVTPAGVCVGPSSAPFQAGVDIPKAQITTLSPPVNGNNRVISLTTAPASGLLQATPAGVAFVATLAVTGDPAQGAAGMSARSAASNPFFGSAQGPAPVGSLRVQ